MAERLEVGFELALAQAAAQLSLDCQHIDRALCEGFVEQHETLATELLRPIYLGETVLPYRILEPLLAILPRDPEGLLDGKNERLDRYPGLSDWWRRAEQCWGAHRSSERLTLTEQLNFHGKLESQFAIQPHRIVYTKSGMHLSAARLSDRRAVIDHTLYWSTAASVTEAHFLCAVLNSAIATKLVRPLMSYGKDERHIDKHIWSLPIPMFNADIELHTDLAALGQRAEKAIAGLPLDGRKHFTAARRAIRSFLEDSEIGQSIEALVARLLEAR